MNTITRNEYNVSRKKCHEINTMFCSFSDFMCRIAIESVIEQKNLSTALSYIKELKCGKVFPFDSFKDFIIEIFSSLRIILLMRVIPSLKKKFGFEKNIRKYIFENVTL